MIDPTIQPVNFSDLFDIVFRLYQIIIASGAWIWDWLQMPIDESLAEFLNVEPTTVNLELLFGSLLGIALVTAAIKLFNPLS